jgi:hypothetical protein
MQRRPSTVSCDTKWYSEFLLPLVHPPAAFAAAAAASAISDDTAISAAS